MMSVNETESFIGLNLPSAIFVGLILALLIFIVDWYNESKTKELKMAYVSLIAGASLAYFFLVMLPEISVNMPEYPLHLTILEFLFVLIGFVFIHISEKLILQRVDRKAQERLKELFKMERKIDETELQVGHMIKEQLNHDEIDKYAIEDMARIISDLIENEQHLKEEDHVLKIKIQNHINEDLDEIHIFTNFTYHFIIGLILFNLLLIDLIGALLFFIFAFFKAVISKTSKDVILFPDIKINKFNKKIKPLTYFYATAALLGVVIGLIFELTFKLSLEFLYILFSFISGVILYIIVREVIPEKEKGNPFYFLMGVVGFFVFVLIIRTLGYTFIA